MKKLLGPLKLFFGSKGGSDWQPMILTNPNDTEIVVESLSVVGDFIYRNPETPLTLKPNESFTVLLRYLPKSVGMHTGSVTVKTRSMAGNTAIQLFGFTSTMPPAVINIVVDDCLSDPHMEEYETYDLLNPSVGLGGEAGQDLPLRASGAQATFTSDFGYRRGGTALMGYVFLTDRKGDPLPIGDQIKNYTFLKTSETQSVEITVTPQVLASMKYPRDWWRNSLPPEGYSVFRLTYDGSKPWERDSVSFLITAKGAAESMDVQVFLKRKPFFTTYKRAIKVRSTSPWQEEDFIEYEGVRYPKGEEVAFQKSSTITALIPIKERDGRAIVMVTPVDKEGNILTSAEMGKYFTHIQNWGMDRNFVKGSPTSEGFWGEMYSFAYPEFFEQSYTNSLSDMDVAFSILIARGSYRTDFFKFKGADDPLDGNAWEFNTRWAEKRFQVFYKNVVSESDTPFHKYKFNYVTSFEEDALYREKVGARDLPTMAERYAYDRDQGIVLEGIPAGLETATIYGDYTQTVFVEKDGVLHKFNNWRVFGGVQFRYLELDPKLLEGNSRVWLGTVHDPSDTSPYLADMESNISFSLVISREIYNEVDSD